MTTDPDRYQWAVRVHGGDVDLLDFGGDEQAARATAAESGQPLMRRRWRETGDGQTWVGDWEEVQT